MTSLTIHENFAAYGRQPNQYVTFQKIIPEWGILVHETFQISDKWTEIFSAQ